MQTEMLSCIQPFVLAGGRSRRFGSDKALAQVQSQRQIDRICDSLARQWKREPILLCSRLTADYHPDREALLDAIEDAGPLAGVTRALEHLAADPSRPAWALIVPCDQWDWPIALTEIFLAELGRNAEAIALEIDGELQPLPSLWHRSAVTKLVVPADGAGDRSLRRRLSGLQTLRLPLPDRSWIAGFNTREELNRLAGDTQNR